tara:strand:+ start:23325 stop:23642 length:318 start_codon:yes stop_codon:yes gene_type:complete
MVHPDQSEQVSGMVNKYKALINDNGGTIHRYEDWGRIQLAYPIKKIHKAHYILMNVEINQKTLDELVSLFRFNDAILRHFILNEDKAINERSVFLKDNSHDSAAA